MCAFRAMDKICVHFITRCKPLLFAQLWSSQIVGFNLTKNQFVYYAYACLKLLRGFFAQSSVHDNAYS